MLSANERLAEMNKQLFNKKEMIILPRQLEEDFANRVDKQVLAGMLANFESLGYQFTKNDIKKMAGLSEQDLTQKVYLPLMEAMKEAKGANVEHHVLFPNFPDSVKNLDIDTLSTLRFMSYFTVFYDEYLFENDPFSKGSLTMSLKDKMAELAKKAEPVYTPEKREDVIPDTDLITLHLGDVTDYYKMVNAMLSGKTSLSEYDQNIVKFALENVPRSNYMPEVIPFKETWALVAKDDFHNHRYAQIDIKSYKDFERLLAALSADTKPNTVINRDDKITADISLSRKQHFRNFSNQERKALYEIFKQAVQNNYPIMSESAIPKNAKTFTKNVLRNRLHFDKMKDAHVFKKFVEKTDTLRTQMSYYQEALDNQNYKKAAEILASISPGVLIDHAKNLVAKEEQKNGTIAASQMVNMIVSQVKDAPMDKLLILRQQVKENISAQDEPVKFRFAKSKDVVVVPFENRALKLSDEIQYDLATGLDKAIENQLQTLGDIGKVYIDPALQKCPIPTIGRNDSGKNRTVASGTQIPFGQDTDILRAALYKKGDRHGFFDFSCAFLDENYKMVGQVSWNNLKEDNFAYHSGDCADTERGVTEIIDVNLKTIQERFPSAKYVTYEGMAWGKFTTVNGLSECFLTLSNVNQIQEGISGRNPLNPQDVKFRVDLTGDSFANIPILYNLEDHTVSILNMSTSKSLGQFGQPEVHRHFDLPESCVAIENYAGELAQTAYYVNERLPREKTSIYDLAMMNIAARHGELVEDKEQADVIFSIDREEVNEEQKLVSIYDKDVITTEFMVSKVDNASAVRDNQLEIDSSDITPQEKADKEKQKEHDDLSL